MNKDWKNWIFGKAEQALKKHATPQSVKEVAWRALRFAVKCGKSNPISFALRPVALNKNFRNYLGSIIAAVAILSALVLPETSAADFNASESASVVPEGEVVVATQKSVQVPLFNYSISQRYWFLHPAVDLAAKLGEPIRPVMAGRVEKSEYNWFGYGNCVIIKHNNGYESLYGHLSKIMVSEGDVVELSTVIGLVGSTGHSTGPHLHLEIIENGKLVNPAVLLGI